MRFGLFLMVLLIVACAVSPVDARPGKVKHEVTVGIWQPELFGRASLDQGLATASKFNFKGDGSFDKPTSIDFRWKYRIGGLSDAQLILNQVENTGTIRGNITVNGINYAAGASLKMKMNTVDLLGSRELTHGEQGFVDFIYGIKFINFDLNASGVSGGVTRTASESFSAPLPQFGIGGEYWINPRWTFFGSFYGFSINRSNKGGTLKTMDTGFQYRFNPKHDVATDKVDWYAQLAWKAQYLSGKDNTDEFVVDHEGIRFGIVGKW